MEEETYIRLHITPLNPSLLSTYLPASIVPLARNISYHTLQTFPERAYGYVELPTTDAERLKKKLNGAILKGTKVRIEAARPVEKATMPLLADCKAPGTKKDKGKKRKRDEIPAVDIGERHVKRGWTVPATKAGKDSRGDKKGNVEKSKFTDAPECLFKTVVPPNVASKASTSRGKDAKIKKEGKRERKGKGTVVHEFAKSTKYATFLRTSGGSTTKKPAAEFVQGKGWVDEDGNMVEAVKGGTTVTKKRSEEGKDVDEASSSDEEQPTRAEKSVQPVRTASKAAVVITENDSRSSESNSSSDSSDDDSEDDVIQSVPVATTNESSDSSSSSSISDSSDEEDADAVSTPKVPASVEAKATKAEFIAKSQRDTDPCSDSSSDSESESESESDPISVNTPTKPSSSSRPQSSSGLASGLSITIPPVPPALTAVHPLEALYKRPTAEASKPTQSSKPAAPAFSFFGADADNDDIEMDEDGADEPQVPLTPYTQRDFEWRGIRSAAPTPDTAFANKRFIWPGGDDEEEEEMDSTPLKSGKGKEKRTLTGKAQEGTEEKGTEESDFQKWFYEHRGEANRAWKKRRKVVAKEKRQRENRKRQDR